MVDYLFFLSFSHFLCLLKCLLFSLRNQRLTKINQIPLFDIGKKIPIEIPYLPIFGPYFIHNFFCILWVITYQNIVEH